MRIIFVSNSPFCPSGYGVETALVTPRMKAAGHDVLIVANYGIQGARMEWNGIPIWPRGDFDITTADVIEAYAAEWKADVVISHWDVWPFPADYGFTKGVRWVPWLPVDRHPLSVLIADRLKSAWHILPWVDDAVQMLSDAGFTDNVTKVPLCIDTKVYRPLIGETVDGQVTTKEWFKRGFGGKTTDFVVGMVAANMDTRKNIHKALNAIKMVREVIPDVRFVLHAPWVTPHGVNIPLLISKMGIQDNVSLTDKAKYQKGLSPYEMAGLFNGMDVCVLPSAGEGWGLPLTEANACGVPAVGVNYTAMPEIAYGQMIEPATMNLCQEDHSYQASVRDEDIAEAIYDYYRLWRDNPREWDEECNKAHAFAQQFDADTVYAEYWEPALAEMQERITSESDVDRWLA